MKTRLLSALSGFVCIALSTLALAQVGHPAKGSWLGYWGPSEADQTRIRLLLAWENREITGVINPGRNAVPINRAELDESTWTLTIEADMPVEGGNTERYVLTGQLQNLGSWINRAYVGSYRLGNESGDFMMALN